MEASKPGFACKPTSKAHQTSAKAQLSANPELTANAKLTTNAKLTKLPPDAELTKLATNAKLTKLAELTANAKLTTNAELTANAKLTTNAELTKLSELIAELTKLTELISKLAELISKLAELTKLISELTKLTELISKLTKLTELISKLTELTKLTTDSDGTRTTTKEAIRANLGQDTDSASYVATKTTKAPLVLPVSSRGQKEKKSMPQKEEQSQPTSDSHAVAPVCASHVEKDDGKIIFTKTSIFDLNQLCEVCATFEYVLRAGKAGSVIYREDADCVDPCAPVDSKSEFVPFSCAGFRRSGVEQNWRSGREQWWVLNVGVYEPEASARVVTLRRYNPHKRFWPARA